MNVDALSTEYLYLLTIFFGNHIESGDKRIRDYHDMTMREMEAEIHIRTIMMNAQRNRRKRELKEEHTAAENALLERLRQSQA